MMSEKVVKKADQVVIDVKRFGHSYVSMAGNFALLNWRTNLKSVIELTDCNGKSKD